MFFKTKECAPGPGHAGEAQNINARKARKVAHRRLKSKIRKKINPLQNKKYISIQKPRADISQCNENEFYASHAVPMIIYLYFPGIIILFL